MAGNALLFVEPSWENYYVYVVAARSNVYISRRILE